MTRHHWHEKTGELLVLQDHEETPKGYIDTHPDNLALQRGNVTPNKPGEGPKGKRPVDVPIKDQTTGEPGDKPLTREEVIAGMRSGGLEFNPKAATAQLEKILHQALSDELNNRGLSNVDLMSTRQMLTAMEGAE